MTACGRCSNPSGPVTVTKAAEAQPYRALWLTWFLVSLAMLAVVSGIFVNERQMRFAEADQRLETQMGYLAHVLGTELTGGDFEQARVQLEAWGRLSADTRKVQLVAANGFVLADFERDLAAARTHAMRRDIAFSYRNTATLYVEESLEPVYASVAHLGWQLLAGMMLVESIALVLMFQFSRFRRQVRLTELEYQRRLEAQQALERMATLDALTGLPNRYLLDQQLAQRVAEAQRFGRGFAVMFVDLDNFKTINDSYGHEVGDELLKCVTGRIQGCLRAYDMLARFGGDEFVVLLVNMTEPDDVERIAEKIIDALSPRLRIADRELFVSASIGISLFPGDADSPGELLRKADAAMYTSKEAGRNCHRFYSDSMNATLARHHQIETLLRQALDSGEQLRLVYQPQVDLASGEISSCEALLRWLSPLGEISPAEFIPVAKQSALMKSLQAWVIDEALRQRAAWHKRGIDTLRVDINIAGGKPLMRDVFERIDRGLKQYGLDYRHIGIELTEHALIEASDSLIAALTHLRERGGMVSLDDFGTGFSSLSHLKTLPVDVLKIDRTFIRDLPAGQMDSAIVKAVIAMGKSMGRRVVAEGVETQAQCDYVRQAGCDLAQGFLFHPPLEAEQAFELLSGGRIANSG